MLTWSTKQYGVICIEWIDLISLYHVAIIYIFQYIPLLCIQTFKQKLHSVKVYNILGVYDLIYNCTSLIGSRAVSASTVAVSEASTSYKAPNPSLTVA